MYEEQRELTAGEKAVGLNFNPGGDSKVNEVKVLYAKIIDLLVAEKNKPTTEQKESKFDIAIMEAQTAQMWAVKAITYQF